ncbi:MAG: DNA-binding response regulator [Candidatus Neomarinimicrobiota bacterium]|nr:MAG: DNA-binding response regulator [Candidatus Neomarinimicrobiota bacterium]
MPDSIPIVVIDDHQLFREGVISLLSKQSRFQVVGEAAQAGDGLRCIETAQPAVVLLDISLPGISGIEFCQQILNQFPHIRVVILTMHKSEEFLKEAFRAGASAYVLKNSAVNELVNAIDTVFSGQKYISSGMTGAVLDTYLDVHRPGVEKGQVLTPKEKEIVRLIAQGWENQGIADSLHISLATVKTHRANIMRKLGLHKNVDLVKYALVNKLIDLDL